MIALWISITGFVCWLLGWWLRGRTDAAMLQAGAEEKLRTSADAGLQRELTRQAAMLLGWADRLRRGPFLHVGLRLRNRLRVARWRQEERRRVARAKEPELSSDRLAALAEDALRGFTPMRPERREALLESRDNERPQDDLDVAWDRAGEAADAPMSADDEQMLADVKGAVLGDGKAAEDLRRAVDLAWSADAEDVAHFGDRLRRGSVTWLELLAAMETLGLPARALSQSEDDPRAGVLEHAGSRLTLRKVAAPHDPTLDAWEVTVDRTPVAGAHTRFGHRGRPLAWAEPICTKDELLELLRRVWPEVRNG